MSEAEVNHAAAGRAHWRGRPLAAVLFDLDGTLLDTVADIASALNLAMMEFGWAPLALREVRSMVGGGSLVLIQRAAAAQSRVPGAAAQTAMLERFFHHYGALHESGAYTAQPYPGAAQSLQALHDAGLHIAVVTNKQEAFARSLLLGLGLSGCVDAVVGGDTCARRKPDPEPLFFACESLKVPPSHALMVGDSINDVLAAQAAHIPVVCVSYGYNEGQDPRTLPCDALLDTLADLPPLLMARRTPEARG